MSNVATLLAAVAAVVCLAQPAAAADTAKVTRQVYVGDLNLASAEGQVTMESRVKSAARSVCRNSWTSPRGPSRCRFEAVANARPQMETAVRLAKAKEDVQLASR